jgi:hypothetical protein
MRLPIRIFRSLITAAGMACLLLTCGMEGATPEYKVKAAFIYNFAKFIEWPGGHFARTDSPFVVAVVGNDPFNGALDQAVANKQVGTHPVKVQHVESADNLGGCEILFIAGNDDETEANIIDKVKDKAVLTVGDSDHFDANGGSIRFFTEDHKMRFEINTDATDAAKLKISSKLLKLARIYKK